MFVYRFNDYTGSYYRYDMDDHDMFSPMFDESLHDNAVTPIYVPGSRVCGYCGTCFGSRNRLFYHLAFHNINVLYGGGDAVPPAMREREDPELGDYGVFIGDMARRGRELLRARRGRIAKRRARDKEVADAMRWLSLW